MKKKQSAKKTDKAKAKATAARKDLSPRELRNVVGGQSDSSSYLASRIKP